MPRSSPLPVAALLAACLRVDVGPTAPAPRPEPDPGPGCTTLSLTSADGVAIEADHCPSPEPLGIAVLVHGMAPHTDRQSWPLPTRAALVEAGFDVVIPDLRGAGESGGDAVAGWRAGEAALDVRAAVDAARAHRAMDLPWVGVGAGHGTRALRDAAVTAGEGAPKALLYLSPGPWTAASGGPAPRSPQWSFCGSEDAFWCEGPEGEQLGTREILSVGGHGTSLLHGSPTLSLRLVQACREAVDPRGEPAP